MAQVTDRTYLFLLEAVRKRPQDSARHHAVVHPISPAAGRDGGLPSGGHLFPPAGHLLELHQSNVSQHCTFSFSPFTPHLLRVIIVAIEMCSKASSAKMNASIASAIFDD